MFRNSLTLQAALVGLCCVLGVWESGSAGLSRFVSNLALKTSRREAGNLAVRLGPSDPESHYSRALVLLAANEYEHAAKEMRQAIELRPRDYFLWLELGRICEAARNPAGALEALNRSVQLAPGYAQPRWQLGNALLRAQRRDEGFEELRRAVKSDPALFDALIDLAWTVCEGETGSVEKAVDPQSPQDRLKLASLFLKHGNVSSAMDLFRSTKDLSDDERRTFLSELLDAKQFREGFEVWSNLKGNGDKRFVPGPFQITDSGFEAGTLRNVPGFGWQASLGANEKWHLAIDSSERHTGENSLLIEWNGKSDSTSVIISQLVLVEPERNYRLRFSARTEKLVTGGAPFVSVNDAEGDKKMLGHSDVLPQQTSSWRDFTVDFTTSKMAHAIRIIIRRDKCQSLPCPAFGRAWFDDFSLEKL